MTLMLLATTHSTTMLSAIKLYHCSPLGYYRQLPMFQRNLIPPSSGQKNMVSCNTGDHSVNLCHNKDLKVSEGYKNFSEWLQPQVSQLQDGEMATWKILILTQPATGHVLLCENTGQIELISKMHIIYQQHRSAVRRMLQRYCYWACWWDAMSKNLGSTARHPVWELCFTYVPQNKDGCLQNLYLLATCVHFPISFHIVQLYS
jgi:hypothetical protein